ncbi:hypothetical protein EUTSA_v10002841mg [Eutrema salsugineum]|uniref:Uncharacterized protein n=1 Tax=Eutrema salsugineum TaxID=72664 RepID=V4L1M2_EUTSA|nr:cation/H(+) antiporter 12 [Eutrema salsugineum]ESQ37524.1 hypothetical protein EUTSA_v10002841mg [Eutrema salsugineum]
MNTTTYNEDICQPLLFNISSNGLWENLKSPGMIFGFSLPLMEIQILLILASIVMTHHMFLKWIGISQIASYMIAGIILGPHLFDLREKSARKLSWDPVLSGNVSLRAFSACGGMMFTFLMSVKTSRRVVFNTGLLPVFIGILTFIVPLVIGLGFRNLFTDNLNPNYMPPKKALSERSVIFATQSSILLPTITYLLSELNILNSEFGRLALSASIINDILSVSFIVLAYSLGTYKNISHSTAYIDLIAMIIFFLLVFFVVKPAMEWIVEQTPEGKPVADRYVHIVILTVMGSAVYSTAFHMKYLLGPLMIGLVIPEGPPLGSTLEDKYEKLTLNVFLPISIAFSTMRCDIMKIVYDLDEIIYNIFLMVLTLVLKLVAGIASCLYCKLPLTESIALSILLSCKSFSEIFLYESTFDDKYISHATYSFLIFYALFYSGIVPLAIRSMYDPKRKYIGYQKRNILSLEPDSDLRILTCVHKPEYISRAIEFIQLLSSPNQELPIMVTVLHLVKLVGQIVPVLISHNKNSKKLINNSYIHTANLVFSQFIQESLDSTNVAMFTALSHENLMHEDICMLALDQTSSMIVVPSGRTWTIDGAFEADDPAIRRLNTSLLEYAPCSIGIFVDRGQFFRKSQRRDNINVCMIFIGGKDDREALSLVTRMKHNPNVRVAVIRLVSNLETDSTNWDYILDHEVITGLKDSEETKNISYTERTVTGGPEVATSVRLLAEEYDLMVVGRDHGMSSPDFSGLKEWIELPELGVIGDLLAVKDLRSRACVLVVQQQHHS